MYRGPDEQTGMLYVSEDRHDHHVYFSEIQAYLSTGINCEFFRISLLPSALLKTRLVLKSSCSPGVPYSARGLRLKGAWAIMFCLSPDDTSIVEDSRLSLELACVPITVSLHNPRSSAQHAHAVRRGVSRDPQQKRQESETQRSRESSQAFTLLRRGCLLPSWA